MDKEAIERAVREALADIRPTQKPPGYLCDVPVGISTRHVHLCAADMARLFGEGKELTIERELRQQGQFAACETLTIAGPRNALTNVRILGPIRDETAVELSRTDGFTLGVQLPNPPQSVGGISLIGPKGSILLNTGAGIARRHLHLSPEEAAKLGIEDGEMLTAWAKGARATVFGQILARVTDWGRLELHLDTDEGNSAGLCFGDVVAIGRGIFGAVEDAGSSDDGKALSLITERDVLEAAKKNLILRLAPGGKITPLAHDAIKRLGVGLERLPL